MPELPEIETIRLHLKPIVIGKTIQNIEILEKKQLTGDVSKATGQNIQKIGRKGKVLFLELSNKYYLNFHLKMSGEILFAKNKDKAVYSNEIPRTKTKNLPNKFTRIIISFSDNSAIFFNDMRKFGWIKISDKPETPIGIDILSKDFTVDLLTNLINSANKPIKLFLMDQDKLVGIGNIYANDILWMAKINPFKKSSLLTGTQISNLFKSIKIIIAEAIKYKGSSGADEMYVLPNAKKGRYQYHFKTYQREGQSCFKCNSIIKRLKQGGRSSFFCPRCQV
ncbi:MAG: Formamidopyrimidine-DNA glycosylase [Candidatus Roizmanbacteria bacterium GW2011_GWA2_36_23]|uniref:Formamidopyrimidine-DNA glycosylase n=1 Tax=Candidatus Roizmanbacteria bacterium GW2011_GWA2_36_23 TaxID=1618480 RepID=A0A0G0E4X7_9BACT|nr:MAG: Formamidopyrimidine-DNA glycosylase [Candidatus Roizmanbacteria bacterium GW2011_GWA2_36_23]